jgi:hypothetical protein
MNRRGYEQNLDFEYVNMMCCQFHTWIRSSGR